MEAEQALDAQNNSSTPINIMNGERDYFLQDLVDDTNQFPDNEIGITLQIGGMLISGIIISGDEYFRRCADQLAAPDTPIHKHFVDYGANYIEHRNGKENNLETTYIHLGDCTFHGSSAFSALKVTWRGRISAVEGFFIGTLITEGAKG